MCDVSELFPEEFGGGHSGGGGVVGVKRRGRRKGVHSYGKKMLLLQQVLALMKRYLYVSMSFLPTSPLQEELPRRGLRVVSFSFRNRKRAQEGNNASNYVSAR